MGTKTKGRCRVGEAGEKAGADKMGSDTFVCDMRGDEQRRRWGMGVGDARVTKTRALVAQSITWWSQAFRPYVRPENRLEDFNMQQKIPADLRTGFLSTRGADGTVDSESVLRSPGTPLWWVRALSPAP
ncbi:hypothetical protein PoB_002504800 [Plakobranchus ocellatus]|uniref:Uncharacterized protein n=1 Tax=Plakobranchus ocellatus TaxID=259542 RepID=A0AAV3ZVS7_9GAST|nr:hypothetical protein PoB_002504800 [Plakobranchus ocellatus]